MTEHPFHAYILPAYDRLMDQRMKALYELENASEAVREAARIVIRKVDEDLAVLTGNADGVLLAAVQS